MSLVPSVVAQISDIRQIGVRNGTVFFIVSIAALTGTPIGKLLSLCLDYHLILTSN